MAENLYDNLSGDNEVTIIESLCVNCEEQGTTRLLLTKIPFFQEIILMSFSCEHCGYTNSELQPGGQLRDKGSRINLRLTYPKDLDRDVVKSEHAVLRIPELDFEIPATLKKGSLNDFYKISLMVLHKIKKKENKLNLKYMKKLNNSSQN